MRSANALAQSDLGGRRIPDELGGNPEVPGQLGPVEACRVADRSEIMTTQRAAVVREALTWLGTPWRHAARVNGAGVDCGQFLIGVFAGAGLVPAFETAEYPPDWHLHRSEERYLSHVERFCGRIPGPPLPGDLVLYRWGRCLAHGAIVVDWPTIVHSYRDLGVSLDDGIGNSVLAARQAGFWSFWREGH